MKRWASVLVASLAILSFQSTKASATLYASTADDKLDIIDPATGDATVVGFIGGFSNAQRMDGIAFSPSDSLFGVESVTVNQLWSINPVTAGASLIGDLGAAASGPAVALEFSPNGTLYTATSTGQLLTINPSTGLATLVGNIGFPAAGDLAFAPNGTLYMSASSGPTGTGPSELVQVNTVTGAGTLVGDIGFDDMFGIEFIGDTLYGLNDLGQLITIDTSTGAGTLVANTSPTVLGLDLAASPVPEPSTLSVMLAGLGLVGLLSLARARQRAPRRADQLAAVAFRATRRLRRSVR